MVDLALNDFSPTENEAQVAPRAAGGLDRSIERGEPVAKRRQPRDLWRLLSLPMLVFMLLPMAALLLRTTPGEWIWLTWSPPAGPPGDRAQLRHNPDHSDPDRSSPSAHRSPTGFPRTVPRLRRIVDFLVDLPTVLPPSVAGVAMLMAFGRRGLLSDLLGPFDLQIAFTPLAVVLAQLFVASPYLHPGRLPPGFPGIEGGAQSSPAALDGASHWQIFRYVVVPMAGR